jgi:putative tryptophan/tyrosine transport system substrate-binding protein
MKRRDFIAFLGGTASGWPLAAWAQLTGKLRTIGVLGAEPLLWHPWVGAFVDRLRELGWVENRTVTIEYRWDEGHAERSAEIAAEFVRQNVDLVVSNGSAVSTVKRIAPTTPIVFPISPDPVGSGLVDSLAKPGGNVTGLTLQATDLASKRVELLREVVPHLQTLAILGDVGNPQAQLEIREAQRRAKAIGVEVALLEIQRGEDIGPVFAEHRAGVDGLYVVQSALVGANRTRIVTLAAGAHWPTIFSSRDYVQAGGLISYGPSFSSLFRRAAEMVDKILRGTKAGEIPVEQPTKFELVVNLTTAQAIGFTVPASVLARADEVIE